MERLTMEQLKELKGWKEAIVVFTKDSFRIPFTEQQRSYKVYSDAKYFDYKMCGSSLFGDCLDGKDNGVRLDLYMHDTKNRWKVDYCYITDDGKAEAIKKAMAWFRENYILDDEDTDSVRDEYLGQNRFRLTNDKTGEIKEMEIPLKNFERFTELMDEYDTLDNRQEELYDIASKNNKFIFESEVEECLNNNEEYKNNDNRIDEIIVLLDKLRKDEVNNNSTRRV